MRILTLNAGSSSLKASVVDSGSLDSRASAAVEWGSDATRISDRLASLARAFTQLGEAGAEVASLEAVGHRMVHGGARFVEPTLIDEDVLLEL